MGPASQTLSCPETRGLGLPVPHQSSLAMGRQGILPVGSWGIQSKDGLGILEKIPCLSVGYINSQGFPGEAALFSQGYSSGEGSGSEPGIANILSIRETVQWTGNRDVERGAPIPLIP